MAEEPGTARPHYGQSVTGETLEMLDDAGQGWDGSWRSGRASRDALKAAAKPEEMDNAHARHLPASWRTAPAEPATARYVQGTNLSKEVPPLPPAPGPAGGVADEGDGGYDDADNQRIRSVPGPLSFEVGHDELIARPQVSPKMPKSAPAARSFADDASAPRALPSDPGAAPADTAELAGPPPSVSRPLVRRTSSTPRLSSDARRFPVSMHYASGFDAEALFDSDEDRMSSFAELMRARQSMDLDDVDMLPMTMGEDVPPVPPLPPMHAHEGSESPRVQAEIDVDAKRASGRIEEDVVPRWLDLKSAVHVDSLPDSVKHLGTLCLASRCSAEPV